MIRLTLSLLVALAAAADAHAETVYSTFGPGDSYDDGIGQAVSAAFGIEQEAAMGFTVVGGDFAFTSFEVATSESYVAGTDALTFRLRESDGGKPGAVLETIVLTTPASGGIVEAFASGSTILEEGVTYWLSTDAAATSISVSWYMSEPDALGLIGLSFDRSARWDVNLAGYRQSAFRINGLAAAAVPEPASLATAATVVGAAGLAVLRRRRRAAA